MTFSVELIGYRIEFDLNRHNMLKFEEIWLKIWKKESYAQIYFNNHVKKLSKFEKESEQMRKKSEQMRKRVKCWGNAIKSTKNSKMLKNCGKKQENEKIPKKILARKIVKHKEFFEKQEKGWKKNRNVMPKPAKNAHNFLPTSRKFVKKTILNQRNK